jgi:hypothetical protein
MLLPLQLVELGDESVGASMLDHLEDCIDVGG